MLDFMVKLALGLGPGFGAVGLGLLGPLGLALTVRFPNKGGRDVDLLAVGGVPTAFPDKGVVDEVAVVDLPFFCCHSNIFSFSCSIMRSLCSMSVWVESDDDKGFSEVLASVFSDLGSFLACVSNSSAY